MIDILVPSQVQGCYEAHQVINAKLDALSVPTDRVLFCIDPVEQNQIVVRTNYRIAGVLGKVREIPDILPSCCYHFCLRVSPMKSIGKKKVPADDIDRWRRRHLDENCGATIEKIYIRQSRTFCAKGTGFWLPDLTMVGRLRVVDPMKMMKALQTGIGRHRAFGFGLLQLFPMET